MYLSGDPEIITNFAVTKRMEHHQKQRINATIALFTLELSLSYGSPKHWSVLRLGPKHIKANEKPLIDMNGHWVWYPSNSIKPYTTHVVNFMHRLNNLVELRP